jgi:hypothetical protein
VKRFGGARLGSLGVSWPVASLEIAPEFLEVSAFGTPTLARGQVLAVEPVSRVRPFRRGVRVRPTKSDRPERFLDEIERFLAERARAPGAPDSC